MASVSCNFLMDQLVDFDYSVTVTHSDCMKTLPDFGYSAVFAVNCMLVEVDYCIRDHHSVQVAIHNPFVCEE